MVIEPEGDVMELREGLDEGLFPSRFGEQEQKPATAGSEQLATVSTGGERAFVE